MGKNHHNRRKSAARKRRKTITTVGKLLPENGEKPSQPLESCCQKTYQMNPMHLPEIVQTVALYCDGETLMNLQKVSTMYKEAVKAAEKREPIWRNVCKRDIPSEWLQQITQKHYPKLNYDRFEYPTEYWKSVYNTWYSWNRIEDCDFDIIGFRLMFEGTINVLQCWGSRVFICDKRNFTMAKVEDRDYITSYKHGPLCKAIDMRFMVPRHSTNTNTYEKDMKKAEHHAMFEGVKLYTKRRKWVVSFNIPQDLHSVRDFKDKFLLINPVFVERVMSRDIEQTELSSLFSHDDRISAWYDTYFQISSDYSVMVIHRNNGKKIYLKPGNDMPGIVSVFMYARTLIVGTTQGSLYIYKLKHERDLESLKLCKWNRQIQLPEVGKVRHIDALCTQNFDNVSFFVSTSKNVYLIEGTSCV